MCRLYGLRANMETRVECSLVRGQNALLAQSRADASGRPNADGWGIAIYAGSSPLPRVERRASAASGDLRFSEVAAQASAHTVLAHVRRASVGAPALENTHPFTWARWTFAHNGMITGFARIAPVLESEVAARFFAWRRGSTDSEIYFLWLLTRLERAGIDLDHAPGDLEHLTRVIGESLSGLAALCETEGGPEPATLNCVLTDGEVLVAARWNSPLHWLTRSGPQGCEICGSAHVHSNDQESYCALVIASEPICRGAWREMPERSVLAMDGRLQATLRTCQEGRPS